MTTRFATKADFEQCAQLHRQYGTTYYFATLRFPPHLRQRTHAVYGFVRVPDEWVDNPGNRSPSEVQELLEDYEAQLRAGLLGTAPKEPVLRAFVDVMVEANIPLEEALLFLDAMRQDLTVVRYETFDDLLGYTRGSAAAVGLMMCSALDIKLDPDLRRAAGALGDAMQLTNFLRDIGEDLRRERVYLPQEDLRRFGVSEGQLRDGKVDERFKSLMRFEIGRARELYTVADQGISRLPSFVQRPVRIARILYSRILDRIEGLDYDVFSRRARTSRLEKLVVAGRELIRI